MALYFAMRNVFVLIKKQKQQTTHYIQLQIPVTLLPEVSHMLKLATCICKTLTYKCNEAIYKCELHH